MRLRPCRRIVLVVVASIAALTAASAAVTVDLDVARLRTMPDGEAFARTLAAVLPAAQRDRLDALAALTGSDPRTDLRRVRVDLPDDARAAGTGSVRLVGVAALRLATLIDLRGAPTALPGGLAAHRLPRRPELALVPLGLDEALLVPTAGLGAFAAVAPLPEPPPAPIAIAFTPGAHAPAALAGVRRATIDGDGAGRWTIAAEAVDVAAADALAQRCAALRAMVEAGARAGFAAARRWAPVLAGATVEPTPTGVTVAVAVPPELRDAALARIAARARDRAGRR